MKKKIVLCAALVILVVAGTLIADQIGKKPQPTNLTESKETSSQENDSPKENDNSNNNSQPVASTNADASTNSNSEENQALSKPAPSPSPTPQSTPTPKPAPKPTPKPAPAPTPAPAPKSSTPTPSESQKMVDLVNSERAKAGLSPLKIDVKLTEVAQVKSSDMVKNNYFSHTSPTYGSPFDMMRKFGVTYSAAAENIALNASVEAAHSALIASQGHRQNILNPTYTTIGIGVTNGPQGKVYVQMFIKK